MRMSDHSLSSGDQLQLQCKGEVERSAIERCIKTLKENSKSFSFASRLFRSEQRDDTAVLYAWCRRADDAVDEVPPEEAANALRQLQVELEGIYAEQPTASVLADDTLIAFRELVKRRRIPKHYPEQLLEGMRMDVEETSYHNREVLYLYCYRVASVVGLMMCHIVGISDEEALLHAAQLGLAMQLTNICRDVSEDWARHRLYLPHVDLKEFKPELSFDQLTSLSKGDPQSASKRFDQNDLPPHLCQAAATVTLSLLDTADHYYRQAARGLYALPWRAAFAIRSASMIYQAIKGPIKARKGTPNAPRAITTRGQKFRLAFKAIGIEMIYRIFQRKSTYSPPSSVMKFDQLLRDDSLAREQSEQLEELRL